jgi:predicted 2-oxoglutarate/Fe(II)-dependent dioxygenase YbiX
MKFINPYDLVCIVPNVIPQETIDFLKTLKNQDHSFATAGKTQESQEQSLEIRNTLWYPIPAEVDQKLNGCIRQCHDSFLKDKYNSKIKKIENVQYLGYSIGGHYIEHNDSEQYDTISNKWTRVAPRDISILFYLSDDYEGGELEFTQLRLTIKPKSGTMIAFPSYHEFSHKVHTVKSGFRDSLVCWIETEEKLYDNY